MAYDPNGGGQMTNWTGAPSSGGTSQIFGLIAYRDLKDATDELKEAISDIEDVTVTDSTTGNLGLSVVALRDAVAAAFEPVYTALDKQVDQMLIDSLMNSQASGENGALALALILRS